MHDPDLPYTVVHDWYIGIALDYLEASVFLLLEQWDSDYKKKRNDERQIAKLFAKHFKIEDQIWFLEHESIHMGVGTPNRLQALVDQGHLKLDNLELLVIDTERNPKKFNIFDLQEVRTDLFQFLGKNISPLMKESKAKIGLF